jgi:hypothetical protein
MTAGPEIIPHKSYQKKLDQEHCRQNRVASLISVKLTFNVFIISRTIVTFTQTVVAKFPTTPLAFFS